MRLSGRGEAACVLGPANVAKTSAVTRMTHNHVPLRPKPFFKWSATLIISSTQVGREINGELEIGFYIPGPGKNNVSPSNVYEL